MSTRCLVGAFTADDPATANVRYVHSDGYPDYILPTLNQIWSTTFARDTTALVEALLAHQWSYLGADVTADTAVDFDGEKPVPGVGMASEFDADSSIVRTPLLAGVDVDEVDWMFLIDPARQTVAVYGPDNLTYVHHLPAMPPPAANPSGTRPAPDLLEAVRVAATAAGRRIADAWAQDALADQSTTQARAIAWQVLASDPAALQTQFGAALTAEAGSTKPAGLAGMLESPAWSQLSSGRQAKILDTWHDAERAAVADRIVERCRMVLGPTGDGRDLSHLHPDRLRIGGVGVFALDDLVWTPGPDGGMRMPVGFAGTLVDTWNGFAVFTCSRAVAEAIVADQHLHRERRRTELVEQGRSPEDADRMVDGELARMRLDGTAVIVDEIAISGDPDAVTRIDPDPDGQYVVMGGSWCWEAVNPDDCDRIVGDLPDPGAQQEFVQLPHTWLRVPHHRLRVTDLQPLADTPGMSLATLALDGTAVAQAWTSPDGNHTTKLSAAFGRDDWATFVAGCRYHGRPASETQVIDALITEYQVEQAVHQAEADGGVLTRLLDEDGAILRLRPVWPAPTRHSARMQLGHRLLLEDPDPRGHLWQQWTGTDWHYLASITGMHTVADSPSGQPTAGQVFASVVAESLLERLNRGELIRQAAGDGIPLDPEMSDDEIRALLRAAHRERGRQAGLPVGGLPTLSAAEGLEQGQSTAGGTPATDRTAAPPPSSEPDQPPAP